MTLDELAATAERLRGEITKAVRGQDEAVSLLLVALVSRGHVLIEGPPGTAKTLLARSFAAALALDFSRVQFTPDLMPGDILGASLFDFATNAFRLTKGPVFTDVLLADEINRAPPKSQAALLQAMNERHATIDRTDHALGEDFFVVATQNPIEQQGTYPLPEAQLDRFLFKVVLDFPPEAVELEILRAHAAAPADMNARAAAVAPVLDRAGIAGVRALVESIRLEDAILRYVLTLVRATRTEPELAAGASTRAADALVAAVRATAALEGRDYALPDDVKALFLPTLRHRVVLSPTADIEGRRADDVLAGILDRVEVPR